MLEEAPHRRPTLTRRAACSAFVVKIDLPKSSRWQAAAVWPTPPLRSVRKCYGASTGARAGRLDSRLSAVVAFSRPDRESPK